MKQIILPQNPPNSIHLNQRHRAKYCIRSSVTLLEIEIKILKKISQEKKKVIFVIIYVWSCQQKRKIKGKKTWGLEEEPIRALARAPIGFDDEEEPGTAQAAPPVTSSRIAIIVPLNSLTQQTRCAQFRYRVPILWSRTVRFLFMIIAKKVYPYWWRGMNWEQT